MTQQPTHQERRAAKEKISISEALAELINALVQTAPLKLKSRDFGNTYDLVQELIYISQDKNFMKMADALLVNKLSGDTKDA